MCPDCNITYNLIHTCVVHVHITCMYGTHAMLHVLQHACCMYSHIGIEIPPMISPLAEWNGEYCRDPKGREVLLYVESLLLLFMP